MYGVEQLPLWAPWSWSRPCRWWRPPATGAPAGGCRTRRCASTPDMTKKNKHIIATRTTIRTHENIRNEQLQIISGMDGRTVSCVVQSEVVTISLQRTKWNYSELHEQGSRVAAFSYLIRIYSFYRKMQYLLLFWEHEPLFWINLQPSLLQTP